MDKILAKYLEVESQLPLPLRMVRLSLLHELLLGEKLLIGPEEDMDVKSIF